MYCVRYNHGGQISSLTLHHTQPQLLQRHVPQQHHGRHLRVRTITIISTIARLPSSPLTFTHKQPSNQPYTRYAEAKSADGPTFLFLFETDVDRRAALERGVKTYWVEQIEGKCNPGAWMKG